MRGGMRRARRGRRRGRGRDGEGGLRVEKRSSNDHGRREKSNTEVREEKKREKRQRHRERMIRTTLAPKPCGSYD